MVCDRCIAAVQRILDDIPLETVRVGLGEVELASAPDEAARQRLAVHLRAAGFDLVEDRDSAIITRVKAAIVTHVHHSDGRRVELAKLVQDTAHRELSSVSKLFSEVEGITLEHYFLLQRLERVKELIRYDEKTFSEIAFATGFSSAAHLSAQFKQLTGMTPSAFRKRTRGVRTALDRVGG
ncbi:MAG: helix-turn-helix transcriptional regulator [Flavobacteriales bacterium]|nr:helix-turn-helix transcriptional regulator [Flavobacteriales bacterium]